MSFVDSRPRTSDWISFFLQLQNIRLALDAPAKKQNKKQNKTSKSTKRFPTKRLNFKRKQKDEERVASREKWLPVFLDRPV